MHRTIKRFAAAATVLALTAALGFAQYGYYGQGSPYGYGYDSAYGDYPGGYGYGYGDYGYGDRDYYGDEDYDLGDFFGDDDDLEDLREDYYGSYYAGGEEDYGEFSEEYGEYYDEEYGFGGEEYGAGYGDYAYDSLYSDDAFDDGGIFDEWYED